MATIACLKSYTITVGPLPPTPANVTIPYNFVSIDGNYPDFSGSFVVPLFINVPPTYQWRWQQFVGFSFDLVDHVAVRVDAFINPTGVYATTQIISQLGPVTCAEFDSDNVPLPNSPVGTYLRGNAHGLEVAGIYYTCPEANLTISP